MDRQSLKKRIITLIAVLGAVLPLLMYIVISDSGLFFGDCKSQVQSGGGCIRGPRFQYIALALAGLWIWIAVKGLLLRPQRHRALWTVLGLIGALLWLRWASWSVSWAFGGRLPVSRPMPVPEPAEAAQSLNTQEVLLQGFVGHYGTLVVDAGWGLDIHADLTYCYRDWATACSDYRDVGRIVAMGNRVELVSRFGGEPWSVIPIKWGARRYLVWPDRVVRFCRTEVCSDQSSKECRGGTGKTSGEFFIRGDAADELVVPPEAKPIGPDGKAVCP